MGEIRCPNCDTSVDEHDSGRCLDAWVSEVVFGEPAKWWEVPGHRHDYWKDTGTVITELSHYSTDIAAAWEVVEKLGFSIWCAGGPDVWEWGAGYWDWEDGKQDLLVYVLEDNAASERLSPISATAHLAICRAALKAMGE